MTTINTDGKPGYVYNQATDTWYQIAGKTDTSGTFEWAGPHTFLSTVDIVDHFVSKKGINNFLNPAERNTKITSPVAGTVCLIRQDQSGNPINQFQYYDGSGWVGVIPSQTGNQGKFLKTDGTITTWEYVDVLPISFMLMGG